MTTWYIPFHKKHFFLLFCPSLSNISLYYYTHPLSNDRMCWFFRRTKYFIFSCFFFPHSLLPRSTSITKLNAYIYEKKKQDFKWRLEASYVCYTYELKGLFYMRNFSAASGAFRNESVVWRVNSFHFHLTFSCMVICASVISCKIVIRLSMCMVGVVSLCVYVFLYLYRATSQYFSHNFEKRYFFIWTEKKGRCANNF